MIKASFSFLFFLFSILILAVLFSKPASAQNIASDSLIIQRLSEIKIKLANERLRDNQWWYLWLSTYSAATAVQTGLRIAGDDLASKSALQDLTLGAFTSLVGVAGQLISPLKPNHEWHRIGQLPERTPEEKRIKLLESEKLMKQNALNEKMGRSFKMHAISTAINLGSGLITWLGFKRSIWAGLENFAINEVITETQIFTTPRRAIKDYDKYVNKYMYSPVKPSPVSLSLNVYPGGVSLLLKF